MPADESFTVDPQTSAPVATREVLMELESTGTFATMQSQTTDELILIPYPKGTNGESANCARPGLIQNVYSASEHQAEAFAFLDWFTNSEEAAVILGTVRGVLPTEVQREALLANPEGISREDQVIIDCINVINQDENMHVFLPARWELTKQEWIPLRMLFLRQYLDIFPVKRQEKNILRKQIRCWIPIGKVT